MTNPDNEVKLSGKEKRELIVQACIEAIPYVGGSLSTIYFGQKQEIRFKRLETFYKEAAEEVKALKDKIASLEKHDLAALIAIIEELNEKVEMEHTEEKRQQFKNYFVNTLIHPVKDNYDERRFFLDILGQMSLLEIELLVFLSRQPKALRIGDISKPGTDPYAIVGAISRLKSYGFLISAQTSIAIGDDTDNTLNETVRLSNFGYRFCEFCLNSPLAS